MKSLHYFVFRFNTVRLSFRLWNIFWSLLEQVLGSTNFYPECQSTNHLRLEEPGRKDFSNQPSNINDGQLNAGWYRINGQAGNRLLDISDLPKTIIKRDIVRVTTFVYSQQLNACLNLSIETLGQCGEYVKNYQ